MNTKLKALLTSGVATVFAFGLTTGLVAGQGESTVPDRNPDQGPPPLQEELPGERPGVEGDINTDREGMERGEHERDRGVEFGVRDSLAEQLVRDHPDTDEIRKHLEEAFINSGVSPEEAAEKSEELARKITDALSESETEDDEFDVDVDEYEDIETDTDENENDDNGGIW